jgi:hypothetical protein
VERLIMVSAVGVSPAAAVPTPAAAAVSAATGDPAIAALSAQNQSNGGTFEDIQLQVYRLSMRQSVEVLKLLSALGTNIDTHA